LDMDATVGPNKIFKDIAWGLASQGVASVRYTKRTHEFGAGLGGGDISSFTLLEESRGDAHAALKLAEARGEVDHKKVYLLGHSLGGISVLQIAESQEGIAGVIVMGTPATELLEALVQRSQRAERAGGEEGKQAAEMAELLEKVRNGEIGASE